MMSLGMIEPKGGVQKSGCFGCFEKRRRGGKRKNLIQTMTIWRFKDGQWSINQEENKMPKGDIFSIKS